MIEKAIERYFEFARERYRILLRRRAGEARPWTGDPILQAYRFCNVFREDDTVTQWVRENVRERLRSSPSVVYAMTVCRFFNTIPTLEILNEEGLMETWDPDKMRGLLAFRKPIVTGAYMVKTPLHKPKVEGLIEILEPIWRDCLSLFIDIKGGSLKNAHEILMRYPWIGGFMAYEIVTDLRHTFLLHAAPDINGWANAGPGATRGILRLMRGSPEGSTPEGIKQSTMLELLARSRVEWPSEWPAWEMREVEHLLCEFDKYERARTGEGVPKQRYNGLGL